MNHGVWTRLAALVFVVTVAACAGDGTTEVELRPSLSIGLSMDAAASISDAFDKADNIVIEVGLPDGEVVRETIAITPGEDEIRASIELPLEGSGAVVTVSIQLRRGNDVLFTGSQSLEVGAGENQVELPLEPVPAGVGISGPLTIDVVGQPVQLQAALEFATGDAIPNGSVTWSTTETGITLTSGGVLTAQRNGTYTVTASANGFSTTADITVAAEAAVSSVSPNPVTAGTRTVLRIEGRNLLAASEVTVCGTATVENGSLTASADGTIVEVPVTWSKFDEETGEKQEGSYCVNVVTPQGTGTGSANLVAPPAVALVSEPETVIITVGQTRSITVIAVDKDGDHVDAVIAFRSTDEAVATVQSTGDNTAEVTAHASGGADIRATSGDLSLDIFVDVALPGRDVVVFNDVNIFDDTALEDANNRRLVRNLVSFTTQGSREDGTRVLFDCGHGSAFDGACSGGMPALRGTIEAQGYTVDDIFSGSGSLTNVPDNVKVLWLWLPTASYTTAEINALKEFAREGGRIIFVGEHQGFYGEDGIGVENQFLASMGAVLRNTGGALDCLSGGVRPVLPPSSIQENQVTEGLTGLTLACASVIEPGPDDTVLFFDTSGEHVLAGLARIGLEGASRSHRVDPAGKLGNTVPNTAVDPTSPTGGPPAQR